MRNISRSLAGLVALLFIVAAPQASQGHPVFTQLPVNGAFSPFSDVGFGQQMADNFSLSSNNTIASIRWWGVWDNTSLSSASFLVRFFNDTGASLPTVAPFSAQTVTGVTPTATGLIYAGRPVFEFNANLPSSVNLLAGTPYYLSLVENTLSLSDWQWAGDSAGSQFKRQFDGQGWTALSSGNLAFQLRNNVVPLPTAAWGGFALIGAIVARRRLVRE